MLFNSMTFLIFLPIVVILYYLLPGRLKNVFLLLASYYFYMSWNVNYIALILLSTVVTYATGLLLEKTDENGKRKAVVFFNFLINFGILFFFKYYNWLAADFGKLLGKDISLNILLPVGISFYTFQAVGYTIDVYRKDIEPEHNFIDYALFVSFFPQLVAGPIERSKNLIKQVKSIPTLSITLDDITKGMQLIAYGFFLKLVIADRAAIYVEQVFDNYTGYGFIELSIGAMLFAIQILCDFNGYTTIAIGSAQLMGIKLMKNFNQPYFSRNFRDFWKRWHISLSSWFGDYLYIPLGGNRKGFVRTQLNILITFVFSGLWHGANWTYVMWGFIHALLRIFENVKTLMLKKLGKNTQKETSFAHGILSAVLVFVLVDAAWIFFRADSIGNAFGYFSSMFSDLQKVSLLEVVYTWYDWLILIVAILVMIIVDIFHEKGTRIRENIMLQPVWARFVIYIVLFWVIILFGRYGAENDTSQFLYFQF